MPWNTKIDKINAKFNAKLCMIYAKNNANLWKIGAQAYTLHKFNAITAIFTSFCVFYREHLGPRSNSGKLLFHCIRRISYLNLSQKTMKSIFVRNAVIFVVKFCKKCGDFRGEFL